MKKILYVEDDALISRLYSQKLVEAGFDVVVAEDGLVAIKRLNEFIPDLVILDLLMPKMTGADVLKYMRDRPDLKSVRVVVFSNSFLSKLTEQVAVSRVEMALIKSVVTPAKLIDTLHEVLDAPPSFPADSATAASPLKTDTSSTEAPAPPAAVANPPATPSSKESETEFRDRVQREFFVQRPAILKSVREQCRGFLEATDASTEKRRLEELIRKVGFLSQMIAMAGCHSLAHFASALEALLFDLHDKPALINESSRNTVVSAIAFLAERLESVFDSEDTQPPPASVLVVDDDAVSNRAVVLALNRAKLRATSVANPFDALKQLEHTPYDLVLLDIDMPGMDGITLFEKMRGLPLHKRTPAVYVTGLTDFKTRARSILSGGNDLITKPILPMELTVKAIALLLRTKPSSTPVPVSIRQ